MVWEVSALGSPHLARPEPRVLTASITWGPVSEHTGSRASQDPSTLWPVRASFRQRWDRCVEEGGERFSEVHRGHSEQGTRVTGR